MTLQRDGLRPPKYLVEFSTRDEVSPRGAGSGSYPWQGSGTLGPLTYRHRQEVAGSNQTLQSLARCQLSQYFLFYEKPLF